MKKLVFALVVLATSAACTRNNSALLNAENGFQYLIQTGDKKDIVAEYEGDLVTVEQILNQSPALQDLARLENELLVVMLYRHLLETFKSELNAGKTIEVKVYLNDPGEKFVALAKASGLPLQPLLSLAFTAPAVQLPTMAPTTIASYQKQAFSIESLDLNHLRYQVVKNQQYKEILTRLQGLLTRRILLKAAQAANLNIEPFIQKEIIQAPVTVSQEELIEFATKNNISSAEMTAELTQRITSLFSEKKKNALVESYVAKNLLKQDVKIFFNPHAGGFKIDPNMETIWGFQSAPIHLALFSEMFCTQCVTLGKDLIKLREEFPGQLKISMNHFFADSDRNSRMLAEASMCAYAQNKKFFGLFYDHYVSKKLGPEEDLIYQSAHDIGADAEQLKNCFMQQTHKQLVQSHIDYAKSINVMAIPTLIIEDEIFEGRIEYADLKRALEKQIELKGDPWYKILYRRFITRK